MKKTNYLFNLILLFILCIPGNEAFGVFNTCLKLVTYGAFCWSLLNFVCMKLFREKTLVLMSAFLLWEVFSSILNRTQVAGCIENIIPFFTAAILFFLLFRSNPSGALSDISSIFAIIMLGQYISLKTHMLGTIWDQKRVVYNYLLGYRVNINKIIIFAICICVHNIVVNGGMISYAKLLVTLFSGIDFVLEEGVATSVLGLVIYGMVILFSLVIRSKKIWRNTLIAIIVIVFTFAFIGNTSYFQVVLVDFLKKDLTLNGRTFLWQQAIRELNGLHWIIGNGYGHGYVFRLGNDFAVNATHNQYLTTIFNYGLIGLFLYALMEFNMIKKTITGDQTIDPNILGSIIALLIMQIPASTIERVYFYIFYVFCCYKGIAVREPRRSVRFSPIRIKHRGLKRSLY